MTRDGVPLARRRHSALMPCTDYASGGEDCLLVAQAYRRETGRRGQLGKASKLIIEPFPAMTVSHDHHSPEHPLTDHIYSAKTDPHRGEAVSPREQGSPQVQTNEPSTPKRKNPFDVSLYNPACPRVQDSPEETQSDHLYTASDSHKVSAVDHVTGRHDSLQTTQTTRPVTKINGPEGSPAQSVTGSENSPQDSPRECSLGLSPDSPEEPADQDSDAASGLSDSSALAEQVIHRAAPHIVDLDHLYYQPPEGRDINNWQSKQEEEVVEFEIYVLKDSREKPIAIEENVQPKGRLPVGTENIEPSSKPIAKKMETNKGNITERKENGGKEKTGSTEVAESEKKEIEWYRAYFIPDLKPSFYTFGACFSGRKELVEECHSPLDLFSLFFSEELMEYVSEKSNLYRCSVRRPEAWSDTCKEEMYRFLAATLLMGRCSKSALEEYWSQDDLIATPMFSNIMPLERYLSLLRALHFSDPWGAEGGVDKVRPVVDVVRESFKFCFTPYQDICLVDVQGKNSSQEHCFLMLCDCRSGYVFDLTLPKPKGVDAVMDFLEPYLDQGHSLYTSEEYSSPLLFTQLYKRNTNVCGTISKKCPGMPTAWKKPGLFDFLSKDNLLAVRWCLDQQVFMLTTFHRPALAKTGKRYRSGKEILKPECFLDFKSKMVSLSSEFDSVRLIGKPIKWYKKVFFLLLDVAVRNSYILHKLTSNRTETFSQFHVILIKEILDKYQVSYI